MWLFMHCYCYTATTVIYKIYFILKKKSMYLLRRTIHIKKIISIKKDKKEAFIKLCKLWIEIVT